LVANVARRAEANCPHAVVRADTRSTSAATRPPNLAVGSAGSVSNGLLMRLLMSRPVFGPSA